MPTMTSIRHPLAFSLPLLLAALPSGASGQDLGSERPSIALRRTPVVEVVERARPAVVSIDCNVGGTWSAFATPVSGTGAVLFEQGIIVTNYHVIAPNNRIAERIEVRFDASDDDRVYLGRVISSLRQEDLALVKIDGDHPFPTIEMSDDAPILGETVVAIGNAVGLSHTVSSGIISGLHRNLSMPGSGLHFKSLIQTDAAINEGNSGGPLLDITGKLVGINTAVTRNAENIGYAIPVARVKSVLEEHLLDPSQARSYLGMELDESSFRITKVLPGGPADLAGLAVGDRVLSISGQAVTDGEAYRLMRLSITPGIEVKIEVERDGARREVSLPAWNLFAGTIHRTLGVTVQPVFLGRWRERYLQLASVDPEGPAGRIGLQPGDVLAAMKPARSRFPARFERAEDLAFLLATLKSGDQVDIEVFRDDDGDGVFERNAEVSELYSGTLEIR
ncbi:MAG TPA: PDZ domain-containing protein [Planctomycetes bacterium]|nr:PDZ domain-containing protein [Planctomycetota bacterium]